MIKYYIHGTLDSWQVSGSYPPPDSICECPRDASGEFVQDKILISLVQQTDTITGSTITVAIVDPDKVLAKEEAKQAAELADAPRKAIQSAIGFGNKMIEDFAVENVVLGITADNMTGAVLDAMGSVIVALQSGSLHEAIVRLKSIPIESKDAKYITDVRLLEAVNKLETKLGISLSLTLN